MLIIGLILFGGSLFFIGHMSGYRTGFYRGHHDGWRDAETEQLEEYSINLGMQLSAAFDKKLAAEISPDDQIHNPKNEI